MSVLSSQSTAKRERSKSSSTAGKRIERIRCEGNSLRGVSDRELRLRADDMREDFCGGRHSQFGAESPAGHSGRRFADQAANPSIVGVFALALETIRRTIGVELFDVQLLASLCLADGKIAEMQTGEGKTLSGLPAAIYRGLSGLGVHVVTTNSYLASRDCEQLRPAFEALGLSVGLIADGQAETEKRTAYRNDITFGTGYEFGFDYLRDQTRLRANAQLGLGAEILAALDRGSCSTSQLLQRGFPFCIVDEIDQVLLDEAVSPLILSETSGEEATDATAYRAAHNLARRMLLGRDFNLDPAGTRATLTGDGAELIHGADIAIPLSVLTRSWSEYVEHALHALFLLKKDAHYIVRDATIQIVDSSTGRIFSDRSWQDGLHQSVEAKEGVKITAAKRIQAKITRQRFYRLYQAMSGMTGTATGFESEFDKTYGLKVSSIPLRRPCQRQMYRSRFFAGRDAKAAAIVASVRKMKQAGRPVLVGTQTILDSEDLAERLTREGIEFELLNGKQDAAEADVIAGAGDIGKVTIATNMAGRGTDIKLSGEVKRLGGLHVIVAERHESARVDRQLIGRAGRQGDAGSAQAFISAEDALIQNQGHWLAKEMVRLSDSGGEISVDLSQHVVRLQRHAERMHQAARTAIFRIDLAESRHQAAR